MKRYPPTNKEDIKLCLTLFIWGPFYIAGLILGLIWWGLREGITEIPKALNCWLKESTRKDDEWEQLTTIYKRKQKLDDK